MKCSIVLFVLFCTNTYINNKNNDKINYQENPIVVEQVRIFEKSNTKSGGYITVPTEWVKTTVED